MSFACGIADHQDPHREKAREALPNFFYRLAQRGDAFDEILLDEENRLNAADRSGGIFERQVIMFEVSAEGVGDDFVETMVFGFATKGLGPGSARLEIGARKHPGDTVGERNSVGYEHLLLPLRCAKRRRVSHAAYTLRTANRLQKELPRAVCFLDFQNAAANMQIALRKRNLDPGFAQFFFYREI